MINLKKNFVVDGSVLIPPSKLDLPLADYIHTQASIGLGLPIPSGLGKMMISNADGGWEEYTTYLAIWRLNAGVWSLLDDAQHTPLSFDSDPPTVGNGRITSTVVKFKVPDPFTEIGSFIVGGDEVLGKYLVAHAVGNDTVDVKFFAPKQLTLSGQLTYGASDWSYTPLDNDDIGSVTLTTNANNRVVIDHTGFDSGTNIPHVFGTSANWRAYPHYGLGSGEVIDIRMKDFTPANPTPLTGEKIFVEKTFPNAGSLVVDPQELIATTQANIWILGICKV